MIERRSVQRFLEVGDELPGTDQLVAQFPGHHVALSHLRGQGELNTLSAREVEERCRFGEDCRAPRLGLPKARTWVAQFVGCWEPSLATLSPTIATTTHNIRSHLPSA